MVDCMVGKLGAVLDIAVDGLVAQLVHKVRFPIPLESWRVQRIEHALQRRVWDGTNQVQGWRELLPDRLEGCLGQLHRPGVAPDDPTHLLAVEMLGKRRPRRHDQEGKEAVDVIGRLRDELPVPLHHLGGLLQIPEHGPAIDGVDWVSLEHERGDDAEVTAAAAQRPEQIRIACARWPSRSGHRPAPCRRRSGCRSRGRICASGVRARHPGSARPRRWWK